ncbi:TIGR01777 family oxidoreductase [Neisseria montereyensis]|uniref:TIGR01777 family oxidoreductase n=1 Tax=Neisseria montereyensis TaxID=2973938 RepID=A0ABT2FE63_9NEIS|nr:TIGR01777 family oxidoreductase [Neisseria montereyensis]MCS4534029.1 TIGR01777 family oxidoreductase [Neisseria montereyensis]
MNILITGGSGFLGRSLSRRLKNLSDNNQNSATRITWLTRDSGQFHPDYIDLMTYEDFKTTEETFDVIINLAGAGIADKRWSAARKKALFDSRIRPTQAVLAFIARTQTPPKLLVSGSAIGWYGVQGEKTLDENSGFVGDFAHDLCEAWEKEAELATASGIEVVILRTGVVIHPKGGMLARLLTPFKFGLGGKLGNGKQIMSWISQEDWVNATGFIIEQHLAKQTQQTQNKPEAGSMVSLYNLTAPNPVSNQEFTKTLGSYLHRPTFMGVPAFILKLILGEMSTLLLDGQKVMPKNLLEQGFKFRHSYLKQALEEQE